MPAMPIPKPHTTLASYADKMGINPIHFFGGTATGLFQTSGACSTVWQEHSWQNDDNVSREELAYQILNAERTMFEYFGYPVYPQWLDLEFPYPKPERGMMNDLGRYKAIATNFGYVHAAGVMATETVATDLPVVYVDSDGDGFKDKAVVDMTGIDQTGWMDSYGSIKVVESGYSLPFHLDFYDILSDTELTLRSWVMIKQLVKGQFPTNDRIMIDLSVEENLIDTVDLIRVYNDPTGSCTFVYEDGTEQDGVVQIVDTDAGIVRPMPSSTSGWCNGTAPDRIKLSVYAGYIPDKFWAYTADPEFNKLDPLIAEAIRLMATARLERDFCGCTNLLALGQSLREDMALVSPQGNFLAVADIIQECPFGTRRGEWLAWNKVRAFADKYISVALV